MQETQFEFVPKVELDNWEDSVEEFKKSSIADVKKCLGMKEDAEMLFFNTMCANAPS